MAKYTIKPGQPDNAPMTSYYAGTLGVHWESKAVYTDDAEGYQFILQGKSFRYNGQDITSGTITSATFKDSDGGTWFTITGAHIDASKLPASGEPYFPNYAIITLLSGNDKIIGSAGEEFLGGYKGKDYLDGKAGDDTIDGGRGNDRLTGGKGDDAFFFNADSGHDVITDFKRNGDDDVIYVSAEYEAINTREGVMITYDDVSILLEGLKLKDLDPGDIVLPP